jgi:hypothetical protein
MLLSSATIEIDFKCQIAISQKLSISVPEKREYEEPSDK